MATNNSWNSQNPAQVAKGGTGSASFTAYGPVVAASTTTGALTSVSPSATSGVPLISQGASSNPTFGTAVVAGGGTGLTSTTAYGLIAGGTTTTGAFQTVTPGTAKTVVISGGTGALHSYTSAFKITSDVMTNTAQPAFLAYLPTNDTNVTGNNALYVIGTNVALTKVFDQGTNLNTNGTFTAPVAGRYFLSMTVYLTALSAVMNTAYVIIATSSNGAQLVQRIPTGVTSDSGITLSGFFTMAASDTAVFKIGVQGGAGNTAALQSASNPMDTYISGYLVC